MASLSNWIRIYDGISKPVQYLTNLTRIMLSKTQQAITFSTFIEQGVKYAQR